MAGTGKLRAWAWALSAAVLMTTLHGAAAQGSRQLRADTEALTAAPHRLTGTSESTNAAAYLKERLAGIGVDEIIVQKFPTLQTRPIRCEMVIEGEPPLTLPLMPMRPNGIVTPSTPEEGVTGTVIHLGSGATDDFDRQTVQDRIVVLDYNSSEAWLSAFRLGAKAVVFVPAKDGAKAWHPHNTRANANLLRFFYNGSPEDIPAGSTVTLHCEEVWDAVVGENIFALIKGTDPVFNEKDQHQEMVILAANYDSFGEVPRFSPGARSAANCAGLLQLAETLVEKRRRRHVLIAFFDGQARLHTGSAAFYRALETDARHTEIHIDKREKYLRDEKDFVRNMLTRARMKDPLAKDKTPGIAGKPHLPYYAAGFFCAAAIFFLLLLIRVTIAEPDEKHVIRRGHWIFTGRTMIACSLVCWALTGWFIHYMLTYESDQSLLRADDVPNWSAFALEIADTEKTPSPGEQVRRMLTDETREALAVLEPGQKLPAGVYTNLVEELNDALRDREFYNEAAWKGIDLSGVADTSLVARVMQGTAGGRKLSRGNRLLLEAAFPEHVVAADARGKVFDVRKEFGEILKKKAKVRLAEVREDLRVLNRAKKKLEDAVREQSKETEQKKKKKTGKGAAEVLADNPVYTNLNALIEAGMVRKADWNSVLRSVDKALRDKPVKNTEDVDALFNIALKEVTDGLVARDLELDHIEAMLTADRALNNALGDYWIGLHASLVLGDSSDRWGLMVGGDSASHSWSDSPGYYLKIQRTFLTVSEELAEDGHPLAGFETESAQEELKHNKSLLAAPFLLHSGEVAGLVGYYNLAFGTCQEPLVREGTPDDTIDNLDLSALQRQLDDLCALVPEVLDHEGLSLKRSVVGTQYYNLPQFKNNKALGPGVRAQLRGSAMPDTPLPGAVVQLAGGAEDPAWAIRTFLRKRPYAFDNFYVVLTDQNGSYGYGPMFGSSPVGFALKADKRGVVQYASSTETYTTASSRLNMFLCRSGSMVLPPRVNIRESTMEERTKLLKASTSGELSPIKSYSHTTDGVLYWYCEERVDSVKAFGLSPTVVLYHEDHEDRLARAKKEGIDISEDMTLGGGISMGGEWVVPASTGRTARDLWRINESRLQLLNRTGLMNSSMEELHGNAEDLLLAAETAPTTEAEALSASAAMLEITVYRETRATLTDLVKAVLVLLALAIPFAFAVERLLIGSTVIYRQMAWFAVFFTITFLILFFTHPAFAIAPTPIIIFLGFTVILLSGMVITLIMRKFEVELKVLQGLTSTVHAADVSRFGTMMAAMSMGLSSMRRRPLRTALTATTIILLTFTILCFASFGQQKKVLRAFQQTSPNYVCVLTHKVNREIIDQSILHIVRGRWGKQAKVCPRFWIVGRQEHDVGALLSLEDGRSPHEVRGVLGITEEELRTRPDLMALIGEDAFPFNEHIIITRAVAKRIGVDAGDTVMLKGETLRVGAVLSSSALAAVRDINGSSLLPLDFTAISDAQNAQGDKVDTETVSQSGQNWTSLAADDTVIIAAETVQRMGGDLHAIALYADDVEVAERVAEDMAKALSLPVTATLDNGVYKLVLANLPHASGAKDLIFPILLGGLVIFGTMLGSVADREREIYTFSALGLAPPHVASLFFSEALVYSIMGGMGGYLIAQGMTKILSILSAFGLVRVPDMNYSSSNAIITILIVMATVLISAIYPAIKASRSANPGILRTWRLPAPEGDVMDMTFPFTVSQYDMTGVVSFLKEHFDNFSDTGLGVFMARDARLVHGIHDMLGLDAVLTLAPFDLGVSQSFELRGAPSEIPGINLIKIKLTRKSGQPKDWRRLNKVLLNDLRKQFLIWRSVPAETMEIYRQRTLVAMGPGGSGSTPEQQEKK